MATKTFYVTISQRYVSRPKARSVPAVFVSDDPAAAYGTGSPGDVARYEVRCQAKSEAADIVTTWLATGKPKIMDVVETWHRDRPRVRFGDDGPVSSGNSTTGGLQ